MTNKTITLADAKTAHPDAHIEVFERADSEGEGRVAIYVWPSEEAAENDDGSRCDAIYWLNPEFEVSDGTHTWTMEGTVDEIAAELRGQTREEAGFDADMPSCDMTYDILDLDRDILRSVTVSYAATEWT